MRIVIGIVVGLIVIVGIVFVVGLILPREHRAASRIALHKPPQDEGHGGAQDRRWLSHRAGPEEAS